MNKKIKKNFPKNLLPLTKVRGLSGDFSLTGKFFRMLGNDLTLKGDVFNVPNIKKYNLIIGLALLLVLEAGLIAVLVSFFSLPIIASANQTVVVPTFLNVGNVFPEVLIVNITDYSGQNITLSPDSTKAVYCNGIARDYNNDTDIMNISAQFFQNTSFWGDSNDNNTHYTNNTCYIDYNATNVDYGDDSSGNYTVNYNCSFNVQYYANPGTWNCTVYAFDQMNWNETNSTTIGVSELIAISLPSSIDYGTVNSTYVSNENITNVTNVGNVAINLSLQGYAVNIGDGNAMNCSKGNVKNISIMYEKYNLTGSTASVTGLSDFESKYLNLTSSAVVKRFDLQYRQNDAINEAANSTYWRIYVPKGVAGTCQGNIIFAGTKAAGT